MAIKRDSSYRNIAIKDNEVELEKSLVNRVSKETKESRKMIASNDNIKIEKEKPKIKKKK